MSNYKKIPLGKGKFVIVDEEDYEYLSQWKWGLSTSGYACRSNYLKKGEKGNRRIWMHRLLNNTPDNMITDHINRNKLDNRKENLRNADKRLNGINRNKPKNNKSGFKGVYLDGWTGKWRAEVRNNGKKIPLGRFTNIEDAIKARIIGEKIYYGL
jgi:hypothetical protein